MMVVVALLAAGALALYLQMADTHSAQFVTQEKRSLYCAEAGLAGARDYILQNNTTWGEMLSTTTGDDPDGYPVTGDLDGDGNDDWRVTIKDDDDEFPTDDPYADANGTVFMVSNCIAYPDTPRSVLQLITITAAGANYRNQAGQGAGGTNNVN